MLQEDIIVKGPYEYTFIETEDGENRNVQLKIQKRTVKDELIEKQTMLIMKLKNDRDTLTETVKNREKEILELKEEITGLKLEKEEKTEKEKCLLIEKNELISEVEKYRTDVEKEK